MPIIEHLPYPAAGYTMDKSPLCRASLDRSDAAMRVSVTVNESAITMTQNEMATLIAKRFIQRKSAKAIQYGDDYRPVAKWNPDGTRAFLYPFMMSDIEDHLSGKATYGHYLLDENDTVKLFAFDIDLEEKGSWVELPDLSDINYNISNEEYDAKIKVHEFNPRLAWRDRSHPGRRWLKFQLRSLADKISREIFETLEIPTASAYSGNKGVHVYGFTGTVKASEAREAAEIVLDSIGGFELSKGKNFFKTTNQDPYTGYPNLSVEIFPKQESLSGKDLGNLMRLPLGRNAKSSDPTFFVDQRRGMFELSPHSNPVELLTSGNPWRG